MKKALFCIFAMVTCMGLFAQQPVVAVAPFDVISNAISAEQASMINDVFFVRLGNTRAVSLVNRTIVERVIREHQFQAEDWSNENKTAELAKALNANWIVQGNIRKMGSSLLIIVQFYDIRTFEFKGGTDLRLASADEAYDKIDSLVESLIKTIGGGSSGKPSTPAATSKTYKIGDKGPGGGTIFFARDGKYMECSGDIGNVVGANAAILAENYDGGGFNDWRLPTRDELNLMYVNLKTRNLGGFSNVEYWSSTRSGVDWVTINFSDGKLSTGSTSPRPVRAIRAF